MAEDMADCVLNLGLTVACHPEARCVKVEITEAKVGNIEAEHIVLYLRHPSTLLEERRLLVFTQTLESMMGLCDRPRAGSLH